MSVTYEIVDRVAVITIDRADKRNAMDLAVFDGLREGAERAGDDPEARAVLVRGAGDHFSSGIDVTLFGSQEDGIGEDLISRLQGSFTAFEELDIPSVAAVSGYCFGGGIQLAAACHLRTVTPTAQLSVMESRWAIVPDLGGTWRLPRLVGLGRATELVATARKVPADEAVAIGLADRQVADVEEAFAFVAQLAAGPSSIPRAVRLLRENVGRDRDDALAAERRVQIECLTGPHFAEAVAARFEGREPDYR